MAQIEDLPYKIRAFLRFYPWRRVDPVPCARLSKPLSDCRVAIVTSSGLVPTGAPSFDEKIKGGDYSFRVIPADTDVSTLSEYHRSESFDHTGIARDRNLTFPLDRLRELVARGCLAVRGARLLDLGAEGGGLVV